MSSFFSWAALVAAALLLSNALLVPLAYGQTLSHTDVTSDVFFERVDSRPFLAKRWPNVDVPVTRSLQGQDTLTCLTSAIYHEARGETVTGQIAVAATILNRARAELWPSSPCLVVRQRNQFSFVNDNGHSTPPVHETDAWERAARVANHVLNANLPEAFVHFDHFHTTSANPTWNRRMIRVKEIGNHIFYTHPDIDHTL